jgi:DNA-binding NtrC family response regulator
LNILLVDDDQGLRLSLRLVLEAEGHSVIEAQTGDQAIEVFSQGDSSFDLVLMDVNMPGISGIESLQQLRQLDPRVFCIVMTAFGNVADATAAMKAGAYDYVEKPVDIPSVLEALAKAHHAKDCLFEASHSAPQIEFAEGREMIGESDSIRKVFSVITKLSRVDTSVLIRGESGTGKELVAKALHFNSDRKKGPFVAINCAAIPENLIESELFGHEKGSFTGADKRKAGKFAHASKGTLFLDEIGDMSLNMQVKLLRVLQDGMYQPIGSNEDVKADVRVIAATSRPLEKMMQDGEFRPDLFYRLNILPIHLPPLRERIEDIEVLSSYLIQKFNKRHGRSVGGFDAEAMRALSVYSWPGNIRELENVVEHAFILSQGESLRLDALPEHIKHMKHTCQPDQPRQGASGEDFVMSIPDTDDPSQLNYPNLKEQFEKEFLIKALKCFKGRINQTALHTQMTKVTLLRKLEKYNIVAADFRN